MPAFKGGQKLKQKLSDMAAKLTSPGTLRVGFLEGATYPNGTPVAMVAAIQNFGAPKVGIPPRPFFSNMVKDKGPGWGTSFGKVIKHNDYDAKLSFAQMGAGIVGQLQEAIIDTNSPALSPVTVMLRGMKANDSTLVVTGKTVGEARRRVALGLTNYGASTKPLVDSSDMLNAASFELKT
jgi:hypothetical protein